jgi:hypothetical protein
MRNGLLPILKRLSGRGEAGPNICQAQVSPRLMPVTLVGSKTFAKISGSKFVDPAEVDDPALEQVDLALMNLPAELFAPLPDLRNRTVMIVGNGKVSNYGPIIDQADCVIRINSMYHWNSDPIHDGTKTTIWAGLPAFAVTPYRASQSDWTNSKFGRIARSLERIWCVSPYQCSARAFRWLRDNGLLSKFASISDPYEILDDYFDRLPAHFAAQLFSMPVIFSGHTGITNFELLLTGVKTALLVYLSGAAEIHLCGFDFFLNEADKMWPGHEREFNLGVIRFVQDACAREGRRFVWREQFAVMPGPPAPQGRSA